MVLSRRFSAMVLHDGSSRRFVTTVRHEGSSRRFYATVLRLGSGYGLRIARDGTGRDRPQILPKTSRCLVCSDTENNEFCGDCVRKVPSIVSVPDSLLYFGQRTQRITDELGKDTWMKSYETLGEVRCRVFRRAPELIAKSEIQLGFSTLSFCDHPNANLLTELPSLEFSIRSRTHANRLCTPRAEPLSRTLVENPRREPSSRTFVENPRGEPSSRTLVENPRNPRREPSEPS